MELILGQKLYLLVDDLDIYLGGRQRFAVREFEIKKITSHYVWIVRTDHTRYNYKIKLDNLLKDGYQDTPAEAIDLYRQRKLNIIFQYKKSILSIETDIEELNKWDWM